MAYDNKIQDHTRAEELLERYFEGRTSLVEEQWLKEYFATADEIPPAMEYARAMFGFFGQAAAWSSPDRVVHPAGKYPVAGKRKRNRIVLSVLTAAAVITLALLLFRGADGLGTADAPVVYCYVNGEPVTDADLALQYTRMVAGHVSETFGQPLRQAGSALGSLEKLGILAEIIEIIDTND